MERRLPPLARGGSAAKESDDAPQMPPSIETRSLKDDSWPSITPSSSWTKDVLRVFFIDRGAFIEAANCCDQFLTVLVQLEEREESPHDALSSERVIIFRRGDSDVSFRLLGCCNP